ncbi:MAG: hypothetical protein KAW56_05515 [Candidatus Marinimicrobia bacterium]|nr:hypothetical protein [Candidatus Neomarinimicrobiota bacterium]
MPNKKVILIAFGRFLKRCEKVDAFLLAYDVRLYKRKKTAAIITALRWSSFIVRSIGNEIANDFKIG